MVLLLARSHRIDLWHAWYDSWPMYCFEDFFFNFSCFCIQSLHKLCWLEKTNMIVFSTISAIYSSNSNSHTLFRESEVRNMRQWSKIFFSRLCSRTLCSIFSLYSSALIRFSYFSFSLSFSFFFPSKNCRFSADVCDTTKYTRLWSLQLLMLWRAIRCLHPGSRWIQPCWRNALIWMDSWMDGRMDGQLERCMDGLGVGYIGWTCS